MALRLLLADDHHMIRAGLAALLLQHAQVGGVVEAADGLEAWELAKVVRADVAILDVHLPRVPSFTVCRKIVAQGLPTAVLFLATHNWDSHLACAFNHGAAAFLGKEATHQTLLNTLLAIAAGELAYTPEQLQRIQQWEQTVGSHLTTLTRRERQVLHGLLGGQTNAEIAALLCISTRTVESHAAHILQKLHLTHRRALRRWAERWNLQQIHL